MSPFALALLVSAMLPGDAAAPCAPQPLPPAIESIGSPPSASVVITFAATPTEVPGRAWVMRLSQRARETAMLEVVRLRQRNDCNRYVVEQRWSAPLPAEDYRALAEAIAPLTAPPTRFPLNDGGGGPGIDGTALELRVRTSGWQVTRTLDEDARDGAALSGLFRALVARHVPARELPGENWRTRRAPLRADHLRR